MLRLQKSFILGLIILAGIFLIQIELYVGTSYSIEQRTQSYTNHANLPTIKEFETKKVQVGDIVIAYKMFGSGSPILLITGFATPMDFWDPILLQHLSASHTVILFDNRGIQNTTTGEKHFSIKQFANDTAGLLKALKVDKADILGWSMGGMIAQELALTYPNKVGKLIISSSSCGGIESKPPTQEVLSLFANPSGNSLEKIKRFLPLLFPLKWRMQNPDYLENLPRIPEITSDETLYLQLNAIIDWPGACSKLGNIDQSTLIIVGMDDIFAVPANSMLLAERIPGSKLVQIEGGGHGLMFQYPETFTKTVIDFLSV